MNKPKICMPLMGADISSLMRAAEYAVETAPDVVEFRADHIADLAEILPALEALRKKLPMPIIFTLRDFAEGGAVHIDMPARAEIISQVIESGMPDMVDIELAAVRAGFSSLVDEAKSRNIAVILSAHFFDRTPALNEMIETITEMENKGADMAKLAVMPSSSGDVLTLLSVTQQAAIPVIAISMGKLGLASRVIGGLFGSAVTFCAGLEPSAPGQLSIEELREAMKWYYAGPF